MKPSESNVRDFLEGFDDAKTSKIKEDGYYCTYLDKNTILNVYFDEDTGYWRYVLSEIKIRSEDFFLLEDSRPIVSYTEIGEGFAKGLWKPED